MYRDTNLFFATAYPISNAVPGSAETPLNGSIFAINASHISINFVFELYIDDALLCFPLADKSNLLSSGK